MDPADVAKVTALADRLIGVGYYRPQSVREMLERSSRDGVICSHVAESVEGPAPEVIGFRFALPPGRWIRGRGKGLTPSSWGAPLERCGYFQTAFVNDAWRGRGVGRAMATAALTSLRELGADAVVTHSWKESPGNSSLRYLSGLGFITVAEHPDYWADVDYHCARDGYPCRCTAIEMCLPLT